MNRHLCDQQAPCLFIPNFDGASLTTHVLYIFLHAAYPHQSVLLLAFQAVQLRIGLPETLVVGCSLLVELFLRDAGDGMFPDEGFVHLHYCVDLLLGGGDFRVQHCRVLKHRHECFAVLYDRFPVLQEQVVGFDEQRLDRVLGQRRRQAVLALPIFVVAAPDDLPIRVVGVPNLLAVISAAVSTDEPGREDAIPTERPTGALPPGQFRLHLLKFIRRDKQYPNAGYGGMFYRWLRTANPKPYGSFGKTSGARRIDISGKIDLALRYPDGTWRIVDYKTDRMLPCDRGDAQAFRRRLDQEYGNQLSTYQAVLEYLTGEKVIEAKLLAI